MHFTSLVPTFLGISPERFELILTGFLTLPTIILLILQISHESRDIQWSPSPVRLGSQSYDKPSESLTSGLRQKFARVEDD